MTTQISIKRKKLSSVLKMYGPAKGPLKREEVQKLLDDGKNDSILTIVEGDSGNTLWGCPGNHFVNVIEKYEFAKPLPQDILVFDISFGEDYLPSP
ncbi:MAG: hypothetical protein E6R04_09225 [Spirochaetes bacterium]|nr:MAG: hypothetical protein E6R04_09225 [Spirochaetota bacterium]